MLFLRASCCELERSASRMHVNVNRLSRTLSLPLPPPADIVQADRDVSLRHSCNNCFGTYVKTSSELRKGQSSLSETNTTTLEFQKAVRPRRVHSDALHLDDSDRSETDDLNDDDRQTSAMSGTTMHQPQRRRQRERAVLVQLSGLLAICCDVCMNAPPGDTGCAECGHLTWHEIVQFAERESTRFNDCTVIILRLYESLA